MANQIITAHEVKSDNNINYDKIVEQFGVQYINDKHLETIKNYYRKIPVHHFLKRNIFYAHRDLDKLLENKNDFYLYTGRGPSANSLHLGHLIPLLFTKYLQDVFNVILVIQLTDDEKFYWKDKTLDEYKRMVTENIKDIIACGFNPEKTFIFSNTEYIKELYPNVCKINKHLTYNQIKATFGVNDSDNIGKISFPANQIAPSFYTSFPHLFNKNIRCLIPAAVDQDPYFRLARDVAPKLKYHKPALIMSKFLPSLFGLNSKMSSSNENSVITINDTPQQIKKKINKYMFSGGRETKEEQEKYGADLEVDVPYQYLTFFLEDDDKLKEIKEKYSTGKMLTGEVKQILIDVLIKLTQKLQEKRSHITEEIINKFCK